MVQANREVLSPQEERIRQGHPVGLVGAEAREERARIQRMLEGFRDQPIRLSLARARLLTESFRESEGQPLPHAGGFHQKRLLTHIKQFGQVRWGLLASLPGNIRKHQFMLLCPPARL